MIESSTPASGADLTFATMLATHSQSERHIQSSTRTYIFASGPLIPTFANVLAAMGCECWNRTTSVLQHLIIPEPHHAKPLIFEPTGPHAVGLIVGMLAAIDFDNKMFLEAHEIDDIFSNHRLSFELRPFETMRTQKIPKPPLGVGHVASERFRLSVCHPPLPPSLREGTLSHKGTGDFLCAAGTTSTTRSRVTYSAAVGMTSLPSPVLSAAASSTSGGSRFGASLSSTTCASRSRAASASRCRFHMLA